MNNSSVDTLLSKPVSFLDNTGADGAIAISSRIRLARNLQGHLFTSSAMPEELESVRDSITSAAMQTTSLGHRGALCFTPGEMSRLDCRILEERRLVSKEFLANKPGRRLLVCPQEVCSLMINEEDHIRLQIIRPGLQLQQVWNEINFLDDQIGKHLDYAFDERLGFLTSCPTNVGTGLRASVMLHLPGLVLAKQIHATINGISKLHMTVRGIFGEGSENLGCLFQISNQSTLGESEPHIIEHLEQIIRQLINYEKIARRELLEKRKNQLLDHVGRAYGLLRYSYVLTEIEALNAISGLRLGVDLGLFKEMNMQKVNELFIELSPGHLQKRAGMPLDKNECNVFRASFCREKLRQNS